ncbi:glycosyl transferase [Actinocatenispora thailandica]|uniref:Glycosyl transferase n=1 Tax=Actinocatenispora thailandica TaxID=227318 RepID=A0A7R7DM92_9ACTN|nr:glycosyltransferase [Actinocatenispora thailandica]BCJ34275.1 glycosyl transferase [Actinocatenispora thailandica]
MKVLHVITGLGVGGAELQLPTILSHTRHHADVLSLYNPGPVADRLTAAGIGVRDLGMRRNTQVSALPRLTRLIAAGRYDVVHAHLYRAQIYGRAAARLARTPVIVSTEHSIGETHLERRRMSAGVRALYLASERCGQVTVAVSETVRDRLVRWGVPAARITVIPNAVDLDRSRFDPVARNRLRAELRVPPGTVVLGMLGRLDPVKRVDLALRAVTPLLTEGRLFLVVGDGPELAALRALAAELGVADRVRFTGERHDVGPLLSTMDVFLTASAQETFGLSALEALAAGLPVRYTTCPALAGLDVPQARRVPGTVAGLRAELAAVLAAPHADRRPVEAITDRYGVASVADRIDALYERLAAATTGG